MTQSDAVILILSHCAAHPRLKPTGHLSAVSETEAILSREMKRDPSHVVFSEGGLCSHIVGDCLPRERQGHCQARSVREREVWLWHGPPCARPPREGRVTAAQALLLTFPLDTGSRISPGRVGTGKPRRCQRLSALAARDTLLNLPLRPLWHFGRLSLVARICAGGESLPKQSVSDRRRVRFTAVALISLFPHW